MATDRVTRRDTRQQRPYVALFRLAGVTVGAGILFSLPPAAVALAYALNR